MTIYKTPRRIHEVEEIVIVNTSAKVDGVEQPYDYRLVLPLVEQNNYKSTLQMEVELRLPNGDILPSYHMFANTTFAMPLALTNGVVDDNFLFQFEHAKCSATLVFDKTGEWEVTEESINRHIPDMFKFKFPQGLVITVARQK